MDTKHQFMGNEKITKLLLQFSIPAIIGMLVNALYNVVDRIYIGNIKEVGHLAIAGVGVTFPITLFIFSFALLVGLGGATNISLNLGKKKLLKAERYLGTAFALGTIISIISTILVILFIDNLISMLGGSENTFKYAKDYLFIIAFGFPGNLIGYITNTIIRSDGNPKMAMATLLIGAITNIILDPIFIFYFNMGVKGAAWATIISQYISAIWATSYFLSKYSGLKLKKENMKLPFSKIKSICIMGGASFSLQIGISLVNYIFNTTLKIYGGDMAIGAMAIIQGIIMFITMPIFGINQGLLPILGYNYGARLFPRVKEALFKGIFAATVICLLNFITIQFFSKYFIFIFTKETSLINIAAKGLKIQTFMLPIVGFQIVSSIYFQAIGKPKMSMFIGLSRQIIVLIPCILLLSSLFGLDGIWFAAPTSDFIATLLTFILVKKELLHLKELEEFDNKYKMNQ
ncbi:MULTISPECIES: MATE family efflux transporter [Fusobacterium]|uniref:MATE family efflux transporter n=1 Tax=Fusobacterium TaxID=848 RepID=UPI00147689FF|nr:MULTISPECIES: MATE family efflux transporter [Fusobacterium]NME35569.1 MATE family efflux transporter [Fusobacterium sp. FSA-380-WT-3A]